MTDKPNHLSLLSHRTPAGTERASNPAPARVGGWVRRDEDTHDCLGAQMSEEHAMVRRYASFVVRCWHLATGALRIRIEHVQTGETIQVTSLAEALAWLEAQAAAAEQRNPDPADPPPPS